jgi:exonuclease III
MIPGERGEKEPPLDQIKSFNYSSLPVNVNLNSLEIHSPKHFKVPSSLGSDTSPVDVQQPERVVIPPVTTEASDKISEMANSNFDFSKYSDLIELETDTRRITTSSKGGRACTELELANLRDNKLQLAEAFQRLCNANIGYKQFDGQISNVQWVSDEQLKLEKEMILNEYQKALEAINRGCPRGLGNPRIKKRFARNDRINDFIHFAINSNGLLQLGQILQHALERGFHVEDLVVNRIIKESVNYIRLSVRRTALGNDSMIKELILNLRVVFNISLSLIKTGKLWDENNKSKEVPDNMTVMSININSIEHKVEELNEILKRDKPTIVCVQETRRKDSFKKLYIPGYEIVEVLVNPETSSRGLVMGVRKDSGWLVKVLKADDDIILISATSRKNKVIIGNCYVNNGTQKKKKNLVEVNRIIQKYKDNTKIAGTVLIGDWNTTPEKLVGLIKKLGNTIHTQTVPKKGTRINSKCRRTKRCIDFAISDREDLITKHRTKRGVRLSDHIPVIVTINLQSVTKPVIKTVTLDRARLNSRKIRKSLKNDGYTFPGDNERSQAAVSRLALEIQNNVDRLNILVARVDGEKEAFLPRNLKNLISKKREIDREVCLNIKDPEVYSEVCAIVKRAIIKYRNDKYMKFVKSGVDFLKNNDSRNAWKWLKTHIGAGRKGLVDSPLIDQKTNRLVSEPLSKMQVWKQHFEELAVADPNEKKLVDSELDDLDQVFNKVRSYHVPECPSLACAGVKKCNTTREAKKSQIEEIMESQITWEEITVELCSTRKNKAASDDLIPSEFYKLVEKERKPESILAKIILVILNKVYDEGSVPNEWKRCTVVPIYKKGDTKDPGNYRGIALINTFLKLLCKILAKRLQVAIESLKLIRREQVGFMRAEECVGQAACLLEICQRRSYNGIDTILCFLDLRKAYDLVPHQRLMDKIQLMGFGNKFREFMENMYSNTLIRVRAGTAYSEEFKYQRGVRQGCPTSPLLFNIYINDLLDTIKPISVIGIPNGVGGLMFADDTVILADNIDDLNVKLKQVDDWMIDNSMEINTSKCGVMLVQKAMGEHSVESLSITYRDETIPVVDTYTYLGVEFNNKLDLKMMALGRRNKGIKCLNALAPTLLNERVPLILKSMLIKSMLIPTLTYGSEIFGMNEIRLSPLKTVLDNGIKKVTRCGNFCRQRTYDEMGIKPLSLSAAVSRARGFHKWKDSQGLISDLIKSTAMNKSAKKPWSKVTAAWLKRYKIDLSSSKKEIIETILNKGFIRLRKRDKSKISKWASRLKIGRGHVVMATELSNLRSSLGFNALFRIRTGSFKYLPELAARKLINIKYMSECCNCNTRVSENAYHLILECEAFTTERRSILGPSLHFLGRILRDREKTKECVLKILLGGEWRASRLKPADILAKTSSYLSAILPKRAAHIAALSKQCP